MSASRFIIKWCQLFLYLMFIPPISAQTPANPNATPKARALLQYLYDCKGKRLITGIQNNQDNPSDYYKKIHQTTGKHSGVWGNDFRYGDHVQYRQRVIDEAIRQWHKGAIVTMMYHQVRPQDSETEAGWSSVQGELSAAEWQALVTPGTALHRQWLTKIDTVAGYLKQLRDAGVPVLWRPYHEMNGGWFWWGKWPGKDGYQKLWRLMYDRYVKHHQLNNLLWVFNPNAPNRAEQPDAYFPGHDVVDILGYDYYGDDPYRQEYYDHFNQLAQGKPLAIAECGPLPDPDMIRMHQPNYVWFMGWRDVLYKNNTPQFMKQVWQHPYCVQRNCLSQQYQTVPPESILEIVPFTQVSLSDSFWAPRLEVNYQVTVSHCLDRCDEVGIVDNFAKVAGLQSGDYVGMPNWDEFLYKAIEAGAYALMVRYDGALDRRLDRLIALIAGAQEDDGYLRTYKTLMRRVEPDNPRHRKWANLKGDLELYCAGHLYEAAVAHAQATGKDSLMQVAVKNFNLIHRVFGPGKNPGVGGHEEIELALVRLYQATQDRRCLDLARFFVEQRGRAQGRTLYGDFCQDHMPLVDQREAVGQAPRATYLYSGAADVDYHTGRARYLPALQHLWQDIVGRKMYVTGGIGSLHSNEGFGPPYDLPNLTAYSEVCAAISFPMWNQRMFKLQPDAKYLDLIELTLYNNFAAGVSLTGDRFFYACPPESDGQYRFNLGWYPEGKYNLPYDQASATRKVWFPCAVVPRAWRAIYSRFLVWFMQPPMIPSMSTCLLPARPISNWPGRRCTCDSKHATPGMARFGSPSTHRSHLPLP